MSDNRVVVELPVDRLEWEMANDRQKRIILRDCLKDAFAIAVRTTRERGRRPSAMKGRPELVPIESTGIIVDPNADASSLLGFRQVFLTSVLEENDGSN